MRVSTVENQSLNSGINFTGLNIAKTGRRLINGADLKLERRTAGFAENLINFIKGFFRKLGKNDELPVTEKPIVGKAQSNREMQQKLEIEAKKRDVVKWHKEENEQKIKDSGHDVKQGDLDQNGYLTTLGKAKVNNPEKYSNAARDTKTHFGGDGTAGEHVNKLEEVLKIKGIDIDLRPERFDFANPAFGIYKNFAKGVDIDLTRGKYVDPEKGIFVDPAKDISGFVVNGQFKHIDDHRVTTQEFHNYIKSELPQYSQHHHIDDSVKEIETRHFDDTGHNIHDDNASGHNFHDNNPHDDYNNESIF